MLITMVSRPWWWFWEILLPYLWNKCPQFNFFARCIFSQQIAHLLSELSSRSSAEAFSNLYKYYKYITCAVY
jgi:hypothetical protein